MELSIQSQEQQQVSLQMQLLLLSPPQPQSASKNNSFANLTPSNYIKNTTVIIKGRCWCCWEPTETQTDPLIRVCLGCKDPDLQYIHQTCIDRYLTSLPNARISTGEERSFKCTRCGDVYAVIETVVPRVQVVLADASLRGSVVTMVLCMSVITFSSVSIIADNMTAATAAVASWGGVVSDAGAYGSSGSSAAAGVGEVFFRGASSSGVEGVRKVPVIWASAAILCVSWWFAVETVVLIAMFAGGRVRRRVLAVDAP